MECYYNVSKTSSMVAVMIWDCYIIFYYHILPYIKVNLLQKDKLVLYNNDILVIHFTHKYTRLTQKQFTANVLPLLTFT